MSARPEQAPLLSSYLSSSTVRYCLHVWSVFYFVMPSFGNWLPHSLLASMQGTSAFSDASFVLLLSGLCSLFYT
jgi:prepilin signal peptidase PulO-like enzyme (type II secretory pathway)